MRITPSPPPLQLLVCVSALLYQNASSTGIAGVGEGLTKVLMVIIICAILYWFAALFAELYTFSVESAARKAAARGVRGSKGRRASIRVDDSSLDNAVNPLFLKQAQDAGTDTQDALIASILSQATPPSASLWIVFRDAFVSVSTRRREAVLETASANSVASKLEGVIAAAAALSTRDSRDNKASSPIRTPVTPSRVSFAQKTPPSSLAYRSAASARVVGMSPMHPRAAAAPAANDSDPVPVEGMNTLGSL